jgi:hypothetical protein
MKPFPSNKISPLPSNVRKGYDSETKHALRTPWQTARKFAEWASLFAGKISVNLVVYADESGTHDRAAKQPGSEAPVFGGYIGDIKDWKIFCIHWQSVLTKYRIPFFHYREFNSLRDTEQNPTSPYFNWGELKRDTFLFELAAVAGGQVPVGSMINLKDFVKKGETEDPIEVIFHSFFGGVHDAMKLHWSRNTDQVSFFLDNNSAEWIKTFRKVFNEWKTREPRFSSFSFVDGEKDPQYMPLQAADLIAYRVRKGAYQRLSGGQRLHACLLDHFLFRHDDPRIGKGDTLLYREAAGRAAKKSWGERFEIKSPSKH